LRPLHGRGLRPHLVADLLDDAASTTERIEHDGDDPHQRPGVLAQSSIAQRQGLLALAL
jgi:hypothetical protein